MQYDIAALLEQFLALLHSSAIRLQVQLLRPHIRIVAASTRATAVVFCIVL